MKRIYTFIPLFLLLMAGGACSSNKNAENNHRMKSSTQEQAVRVPVFQADSAYRYVAQQVAFGPRVPNSAAHRACGDYLIDKLTQLGAQVHVQTADLVAYDGTLLKARNIIGSYHPETKRRIALFAHWDSRPWADDDPDPKNHRTPVPGANDGASGIGVLLEIARNLQQQLPALGIDIILLDAEDYGPHQTYQGMHREEHWALGSQYWAQNPHVQGYNARFGILLDMVGGRDATFYYEGYSEEYAKSINRKVWDAARQAGFGNYFIPRQGTMVTDDHVFVNRYARIPTIDIIATDADGSFYHHWHTVKDDLEGIDRNTLKAVGQTVMEVIYRESGRAS